MNYTNGYHTCIIQTELKFIFYIHNNYFSTNNEQDGDRERSRKKERDWDDKIKGRFYVSAWKVYCRKAGIDVMHTKK